MELTTTDKGRLARFRKQIKSWSSEQLVIRLDVPTEINNIFDTHQEWLDATYRHYEVYKEHFVPAIRAELASR